MNKHEVEVKTILYAQASEALQEEVSEELKIQDPDEPADLGRGCENCGCHNEESGAKV